MLKAEFSDEAATACLLAAERILQRNGVPSENGEVTYKRGDLIFCRTNGNEIEIRYREQVGLKVPPEGSRRPLVWLPGDWVHEVDEIDQQVATFVAASVHSGRTR